MESNRCWSRYSVSIPLTVFPFIDAASSSTRKHTMASERETWESCSIPSASARYGRLYLPMLGSAASRMPRVSKTLK